MQSYTLMKDCQRCGNLGSIMSMFNTDIICRECEVKEKAHPDWKRARDTEAAACAAGNYSFPGVGKPDDL